MKVFWTFLFTLIVLQSFCEIRNFRNTEEGANDPFITTWKTSVDNQEITIPTYSIVNDYDYAVNWGDGNVEVGFNGDAIHRYAVAGTYTISITGVFPRIYFNDSGSSSLIISIEQWGDIEWTSMSKSFFGCSNLTYNAIDTPNLSKVKSLSWMFSYASSFTGDIGNWDVSTITDMSYMFAGAYLFNQKINSWDVGNVTTTRAMFYKATSFNQDINSWNVSSVSSMVWMFYLAESFNQNLNNWNVSNVFSFEAMFYGAESFNQPLINWNVANASNMSLMFNRAYAFNQDIDNWNVSNVKDMSDMFNSASSFNKNIGGWDVSSVTNMSRMLMAQSFNQDIGNWNVANVKDMKAMFSSAKAFNMDIGNWDVNNVLDMSNMFYNALLFDQGLGSWNVSNVTNMRSMFQNADSFNQDIENWDVSSVESMFQMFNSANSFNQDINKWDVRNTTDMRWMFRWANSFNQYIGDWNVSNTEDMSYMFQNASSFDQDLSKWDVGQVSEMDWIFSNSAMSELNYDKILKGWASLTSLQSNVTLGADEITYCMSESDRQSMIDNYQWAFKGDSKLCINYEPTDILLSNNRVDERNNKDQIVGYLTTVDINIDDLFSYSLVTGTGDLDNTSFTIVDNQLYTTEVFDFESKAVYSIRVSTTDQSLSYEKNVIIEIGDVTGIVQDLTIDQISDHYVNDAPFEIEASIDSGLELTYEVSGPATISGTVITLDKIGGVVVVTVSQTGDDDFASASEQISFKVNKVGQTITIEPIDDQNILTGFVLINASSSSGLPISLSITGPATIVDNEIVLNGEEGSIAVIASQSGDSYYNEAEDVSISFRVYDLCKDFLLELIDINAQDVDINVSGGIQPYRYNWSNGSTNEDIFNVEPGNYTITVTDSVGCLQSMAVTVEETILGTLIDTSKSKIKVSFYPNPVENTLYLEIELKLVGKIHLQILDLFGKIINEKQFDNILVMSTNFDTSLYPVGQYILVIQTANFREFANISILR